MTPIRLQLPPPQPLEQNYQVHPQNYNLNQINDTKGASLNQGYYQPGYYNQVQVQTAQQRSLTQYSQYKGNLEGEYKLFFI